jgi:hypothetical protein
MQNYIKGTGPRNNHYGADTAFKHQQAIEMAPFYVHPEFAMKWGRWYCAEASTGFASRQHGPQAIQYSLTPCM